MYSLQPLSYVYISIAIFGASASHPVPSYFGPMLNDIVHLHRSPANIVLTVCWSPAEMRRVYSAVQFPVAFVRGHQLTGDCVIAPTFNNESNWRSLVYIVVDVDCPGNGLSCLQRIDASYFKHPVRWLLLTAGKVAENHWDWKDLPINVDSQFTLAEWNASAALFNLSQVYRLENRTIIEPFGVWRNSVRQPRFQDLRSSPIVSRRRRNLQGSTITATYVITTNETLKHLTDFRDSQIDTVTKVNYVTTDVLIEALNAVHSPRFVDTWGYLDKNTDRYSGMLGEMISGVSDVAATTFFIIDSRVPLLEFSSMINPTPIRFIFRAPPLSQVLSIYSMPFSRAVWLSAALVVILCCAVIGATLHFPAVERERLSWSDLVLLGIAGIAQMGSPLEGRRLSTRLSLMTFLVLLLFLFISYTANIVALLQATTRGIRSLEDLYNSRLEMGVANTSYARYYFPNAVGRVHRAIYRERVAPPNERPRFENVSYGVDRLRQGMYAFHSELGPVYNLIEKTFFEHEKCGLYVIDFLGVPSPWLALPKRSKYKEIIRVTLFKIREHGLQSRILDQMYTRKPVCTNPGQSFQPVRFVDCRLLLEMIGLGCLLATVVFGIEYLTYVWTRNKWTHRLLSKITPRYG